MKKTSIFLLAASLAGVSLLGSCGPGEGHDSNQMCFTRLQAEASYRLVGSAADYDYADSTDLSFGSRVDLLMPRVLFGNDPTPLQDTIMMLAFNAKGSDMDAVMRNSLPVMASSIGYELTDTVLPDSVVAEFINFTGRYDGFMSVTGDVETLTPTVMSYAVTYATYVPGAAHGMYGTYYVNYDMSTGKIVTLEDLFEPEALKTLVSDIRTQAREMRDVIGSTDIDSIPSKGNYYITAGNELVFAYQPYEVASYAQGEIQIPIPAYLLSTGFTPLANRLLLKQ